MIRKAMTPVFVVAGGFAIAALLIATGPTVEMKPLETVAPLVRTVVVEPQAITLNVITNGTVVPRTESELIPEVSGRVLVKSPSLVSGGFFSRGDVLLRVEPLDYEVALEQARAGLARAESELINARKGLERQSNLKQRNATSEAQRDDALNRMRVGDASLREAKAGLSRARRDLERTELRAPYDGRVRSQRVDVGQFVNRGSPVATIYAVDFAEVRLPIHDEELAYLNLPLVSDATMMIPVTLSARFAGAEHEWQGEVVRTEGELDPRTRMVTVVARVEDPYARSNGRPPLSVGLFVKAEIQGVRFENLVTLPRSALRGENRVYVVDAANKLRFRAVEVMRISQNQVYISAGLLAGERVCVSPVMVSEDGMLVRVAGADDNARTAAVDGGTGVGS